MYRYLMLISFILISSCTDKYSENKAIRHSHKIISLIDSTKIETFHTWEYSRRGNENAWDKELDDVSLYDCLFSSTKDTIEVSLFDYQAFTKDFPLRIKLDSALFVRYIFKLSKDSVITVSMLDTLGRDHFIKENFTYDQIFDSHNPFIHFSILNDFKDSLDVYGISYNPRVGGFIEFYIEDYYSLIYLPDSTISNPELPLSWKKAFLSGKKIKDNWTLIHLYDASR